MNRQTGIPFASRAVLADGNAFSVHVKQLGNQFTIFTPDPLSAIRNAPERIHLVVQLSVGVPMPHHASTPVHLERTEQLATLAPLFAHPMTKTTLQGDFKGQHPILMPIARKPVELPFAKSRFC